MHNKETYTRVYTRICARIDIRVYAKYARMIRVCVVRLYLSCTVCTLEMMDRYLLGDLTHPGITGS